MTAILQVEGIHVRFGGLHAVRDVNLEVRTGAIVGLIGPNGAGKTTLFNALSGLQTIGGGSVRFRGNEITDLPAHRRAGLGIGRSFQHPALLWEETVLTNLLSAQYLTAGYRGFAPLLRPGHHAKAERIMRARAMDVARTFGLTSSLRTAVRDLSFGKARFVEIAGLLTGAPSLLLLDEPTTGLDTAEIDQLRTALCGLRDSGTSILVVAHDVRFVMQTCDDVYVLAQGELLAHGDPASVRRDPRVVDAYLGRAA